MIKKLLEEDPEAKKDYEKIRDELDGYVADQGLEVPDDGRSIRTREDFDDLDYEVVMQMTARNHTLVKWRYGLGALCLLLLCLCGFLFRLSENNYSHLMVERAEHAQDQTSYNLELEHALKNIPKWDEMKTKKAAARNGLVLLHYFENQEVVFLDLSHCDTIAAGHAYYVFFNNDLEEDAVLVIAEDDRLALHPVLLNKTTTSLQVFSREENQFSPANRRKEDLIADISVENLLALGN